jgi:hypothetical protein
MIAIAYKTHDAYTVKALHHSGLLASLEKPEALQEA